MIEVVIATGDGKQSGGDGPQTEAQQPRNDDHRPVADRDVADVDVGHSTFHRDQFDFLIEKVCTGKRDRNRRHRESESSTHQRSHRPRTVLSTRC